MLVRLEPNKPLLCNEKLHDGGSIYYHLKDLEQDTGYELRISYRAVVPTEFIMEDVGKVSGSGRKLMNIDKLVFYTGPNAEEKLVKVTAFRSGVSFEQEKLYIGLPLNVWKMVVYVLLTIFVVIKCCVQPSLGWVNNESGKLE